MIYANFVGAMLIGSLYFNKVSAIKTALVYGGMLGFVLVLNMLVVQILFKNVDTAFPFNNILIKVGNDVGVLELPAGVSKTVGIAVSYIVPGILWLTAYIRLREKEI